MTHLAVRYGRIVPRCRSDDQRSGHAERRSDCKRVGPRVRLERRRLFLWVSASCEIKTQLAADAKRDSTYPQDTDPPDGLYGRDDDAHRREDVGAKAGEARSDDYCQGAS